MNPLNDTTNAAPANAGPARTVPAVRRKRPHPARRTRRIAGATGVVGMVVMTGYMSLNPSTSSAQPANSVTTVAASSASKTATAKATSGATAAAPAATAITKSASS
jgi:hypothetical protein